MKNERFCSLEYYLWHKIVTATDLNKASHMISDQSLLSTNVLNDNKQAHTINKFQTHNQQFGLFCGHIPNIQIIVSLKTIVDVHNVLL